MTGAIFDNINIVRLWLPSIKNPVLSSLLAQYFRSPPDPDKTTSTFCPAQDSNGDPFLQFGSCCNDLEEEAIEAKFLEAGALSAGCSDLYQQVVRLVCGYEPVRSFCESFRGS